MTDESRSGNLRPIGGLMSETLRQLRPTDGTQAGLPTKRTPSEITTQSSKPPPETGMRPGAHGSGLQNVSLPAIIARTELLGGLHRNPAEFLPPLMRSAIDEMWDGNNTGYGWDGFVSEYQITEPISEEDRAAALAFIDEALEPATENFILAELARVRALTVSRDIGQDLALVFAAFADELARYPADVVREVLRAWPKSNKFWPSMAELTEHLDRLVTPRKALRDALKRGYREPEYSPDWTPPPTEEQKREVMELLENNGIHIDERGRVRHLERERGMPMTKSDRERMKSELAEFRRKWNENLLAAEGGDTI